MLIFARWANLVLVVCAWMLGQAFPAFAQDHPQIEFETSRGSFVMELYPESAPRTVENFMLYVNSGFYAGTVFHRSMQRFLLQGGGLTDTLEPKTTLAPITNESTNGLSNDFGTVAMARGLSSNSATSQFFVNLSDNRFLNYYKPEAGLEGYTVFGRVVRGLDVLLEISNGATRTVGKLMNVPTDPPVIRSARLLDVSVIAENTPPVKTPTAKAVETKTLKLAKKGKKRGQT